MYRFTLCSMPISESTPTPLQCKQGKRYTYIVIR
uniref:Uncharacterized protein n=1 Tax=Siphoviridae sp. ctA4S13 TaxID=2826179 RepID=A0A8S5MQY3_9CAUD|nr:MAG TPA: hypothetical protein [Siphoviridae sp. ctA4S13]